jgi:hypothetical protein
MFDLELHPPRRIYFNQVHKLPRNDAGAEVHSEVRQRMPGHDAFKDPAYRASQPDGNLCYPQRLAAILREPLQVNVVDPHYFSPMNVDDLTVQYVLLKKQQVFIAAERVKQGILTQFDGSGGGLHDVFHRYQPDSLTRLEQQSGHIAGGQSGRHGDVLETALDAPLPVRDRGAE